MEFLHFGNAARRKRLTKILGPLVKGALTSRRGPVMGAEAVAFIAGTDPTGPTEEVEPGGDRSRV